jgi:uncharacterized protein (TIGR00725 family)
VSWKSVAVVGAGDADGETSRAAEEVGRLLAERGYAVICGGGNGVMEAACKGAKLAGGLTVGILGSEDAAVANGSVDVPIATGFGEARNMIVVRAATHGIIAVGGEFGTLSEIAFALKMGKPVVGLNTWELAKLGTPDDSILTAQTPKEAVEKLLANAKS